MKFLLLSSILFAVSAASCQMPAAAAAAAATAAVDKPSAGPAVVSNAVDAAHQATPDQVREYFALLGLEKTMKTFMAQMLGAMHQASPAYIPAAFWQDMDGTFARTDFLSVMVPIYQKHLSRQDMVGILAFYHTDAGRHLLTSQAPMMQEAQEAFQQMGQRLGVEVGARHSTEIDVARRKYEAEIASRQAGTAAVPAAK